MELQRSLINILKRNGPRTEHWGTPDVTLKGRDRLPNKRTRDNISSSSSNNNNNNNRPKQSTDLIIMSSQAPMLIIN
jgi:hypothetical protein